MPRYTRKSALTGRMNIREISVDPARVAEWEALGKSAPFIQKAFPDLSPDDREFLLNGTTPEEHADSFRPEVQE